MESKKCNCWFEKHIDIDYHISYVHPNFNDTYIISWLSKGRPRLSPYD
jgi:hypothetical protein